MYPSIEPYDSGHLDVGDGHAVYWEVVGSPDGLPAIWLHGGPGAPASPSSRRNSDPVRYRAVIFDQRGCGRSRPLASDADADLTTNTTDHLVADMERLRSHLGIDRWVVVGGSWGVTLGLVYAQRHPERVLGMVLAAVTSGRWRETQWITRDMGRLFPRQWDRFAELLPEAGAKPVDVINDQQDQYAGLQGVLFQMGQDDGIGNRRPSGVPSATVADAVAGFRPAPGRQLRSPQVSARILWHADGGAVDALTRVPGRPTVVAAGSSDGVRLREMASGSLAGGRSFPALPSRWRRLRCLPAAPSSLQPAMTAACAGGMLRPAGHLTAR
jgi:pimeloyl-ACP methyl ester carboxylesterase